MSHRETLDRGSLHETHTIGDTFRDLKVFAISFFLPSVKLQSEYIIINFMHERLVEEAANTHYSYLLDTYHKRVERTYICT